jgi:hypothetical protein
MDHTFTHKYTRLPDLNTQKMFKALGRKSRRAYIVVEEFVVGDVDEEVVGADHHLLPRGTDARASRVSQPLLRDRRQIHVGGVLRSTILPLLGGGHGGSRGYGRWRQRGLGDEELLLDLLGHGCSRWSRGSRGLRARRMARSSSRSRRLSGRRRPDDDRHRRRRRRKDDLRRRWRGRGRGAVDGRRCVGVRLLVHRHGRAVAHRCGLVLRRYRARSRRRRRPHEAGGTDTSSSGPSPLAVRRAALFTAVPAASPAAATVRHGGGRVGGEAGGSGGSQWIKNDSRGRERGKEMAGWCVESGTVASL